MASNANKLNFWLTFLQVTSAGFLGLGLALAGRLQSIYFYDDTIIIHNPDFDIISGVLFVSTMVSFIIVCHCIIKADENC